MFDIGPEKLLIILVVALLVLGPEKLPKVARHIGAAWGDIRRFRERIESEVRNAIPDLPVDPAMVKSPLAFLNDLTIPKLSQVVSSEEAGDQGSSPSSADAKESNGSSGGEERMIQASVMDHGSMGSMVTAHSLSSDTENGIGAEVGELDDRGSNGSGQSNDERRNGNSERLPVHDEPRMPSERNNERHNGNHNDNNERSYDHQASLPLRVPGYSTISDLPLISDGDPSMN